MTGTAVQVHEEGRLPNAQISGAPMQNPAAAIDENLPVEPAKAAQYLLYAIVGLVVLSVVWATFAKLDRVTRATGRVIPSAQLQEVQYLDAGIVSEILVRAGDKVTRGDLLVRLDPTQVDADFNQGRDGYNLLLARIERLEAEVAGAPLEFSDDLIAASPKIVEDERKLYDARRAEFESAQSVAASALDDARSQLQTSTNAFTLASEELRIIEPLVNRGVEPQIELVRTRQRYSMAEGEKSRAEIAVAKAETELKQIDQNYAAAAADSLAKARAEMAEFSGALPALRDKKDRTALRAPIDGVVNRVLVSTISGVIKPGDTVVEIVPEGDSPMIKARVAPADIGFIYQGQKARVKLTAYDSSTYGSMPAHIETVAADAIEDEKTGEPYFEIWVRTEKEVFETRDGALTIAPGMSAEVDILNGKRSVLAYLFKPIAEVKNKALTEN